MISECAIQRAPTISGSRVVHSRDGHMTLTALYALSAARNSVSHSQNRSSSMGNNVSKKQQRVKTLLLVESRRGIHTPPLVLQTEFMLQGDPIQ